MDYEVCFHDRDSMRIMPLAGEFDLSNSDALAYMIAAALQGANPVIIDFSAAVYIDSTVLGVLVQQKKRAGERLQLVVPPGGKLRRLFDITGLRTGLAVKDSIEAATFTRR